MNLATESTPLSGTACGSRWFEGRGCGIRKASLRSRPSPWAWVRGSCISASRPFSSPTSGPSVALRSEEWLGSSEAVPDECSARRRGGSGERGCSSPRPPRQGDLRPGAVLRMRDNPRHPRVALDGPLAPADTRPLPELLPRDHRKSGGHPRTHRVVASPGRQNTEHSRNSRRDKILCEISTG